MTSTLYDNLTLEDPRCDPRLLPTYLRRGDNSAQVKRYRIAVEKANLNCLNEEQRQQIQLCYGQGYSKHQIARIQGKSWAAVSRSMAAAEQAVRAYVELYMQIYEELALELRRQLEEEEM